MVQQMILMPSTLSHGNHVRYYSRNQVHTMTWRWPCATACSCSKDSYRSRDTKGRKEHGPHTSCARLLRSQAALEGATTAVLRLINYHCHSFTFAIRRVRVPNIVPYKASWFADHLCVNSPAITPLLQRHTSSVIKKEWESWRQDGRREEKRERETECKCKWSHYHWIFYSVRRL